MQTDDRNALIMTRLSDGGNYKKVYISGEPSEFSTAPQGPVVGEQRTGTSCTLAVPAPSLPNRHGRDVRKLSRCWTQDSELTSEWYVRLPRERAPLKDD